MKPTITLKIIKEDIGYGATGQWEDRFMATCGDTWEELQSMIVDMVNLTLMIWVTLILWKRLSLSMI